MDHLKMMAALVPLLLAGASATAMPPADAVTFDDFDLNGDGVVTRQEMDQVRRQRTTTAGAGARAPSRPGPPAAGLGIGRGGPGRQMPTFRNFDLDGDGTLTEEEFIEARGQRVARRAKEGRQMRGLSNMMQFSDLDRNGDGRVGPDEFQAGVAQHRQSHRQNRGFGRPGMGPQGVGQRRMGRPRIDRDGDGYVSRQEFEAMRARRMKMRGGSGISRPTRPQPPAFSELDSNGDGRISPQELDTFRAARMRGYGPGPR